MNENPEEVPVEESLPQKEDDDQNAHSTRPGLEHQSGQVNGLGGMTVPTQYLERDHVHGEHGADSWQAKILHYCHMDVVQYFLMGLLILDVMILFVELYLSAEFPSCHIIERDAISCCNSTEDDHARFLSGEDEHHDICEEGSEGEYAASCDEYKYPAVHNAHVALRGITLFILGVFFIELNVLIAAMGPRKFFGCFFYSLDFVIVSVSLALEITFMVIGDAQLELLVGLLILSRLWRFVRIGHGIFEATHEFSSKQHEAIEEHNKQLEALLKENGIEIPKE